MITKKRNLFFILFAVFLITACAGGLVAPPGGELTDKDLAMDVYYQSLKWYNNTLENLMANIPLMPKEEQAGYIGKADVIKRGADTSLAGWKLAIESESYAELSANREGFKNMKNQLIDLLVEIAGKIGAE